MNSQSEKDIKVTTDFPKFIFTFIADQIKQADTKAVGVLGILGIVTGALLSRLNTLKDSIGITDPKWLAIFTFSTVMIVLALKFIVTVVYPRESKTNTQNIIYFKDISEWPKEEYVKRGESLTNADIIMETYGGVHNLSKIARKKYRSLRYAMIMTTITIIWTIAVLILS